MRIVISGTVKNGAIELIEKVDLPDGTPVKVTIEAIEAAVQPQPRQDLTNHPFIGMWADRTDIGDSAEYVRKMRQKWSNRYPRRD